MSDLKFWWFYETPPAQESQSQSNWTPFTLFDNSSIENSFLSDSKDKNSVLVFGGRYQVNLNKKKISSIYWKEPSRKILRGSWFVTSGAKKSDSLIPFSEEEAAALEETFYPGGVSNFEPLKPKIFQNKTHYITDRNEAFSTELAEEKTGPEFWQVTNDKVLYRFVLRGYPHQPVPEYDETLPVRHLVLVIHGIGEHLWSKGIQIGSVKIASHTEQVNHLRTIGYELDGLSIAGTKATSVQKESRVEFLPIHWHQFVHTKDFQSKISKSALPSLGPIRIASNQVLIDSLVYLSAEGQKIIHNAVIDSLNATYSKFRENSKEFNGKVSIIGHSLGSVISFDILRSHSDRLKFHPENLYALGSPIGLFSIATHSDKFLTPETKLPTCPHVWNVFHPHDPVAYRIEPILNSELCNLNPAVVDAKNPSTAAKITAKVQELAGYVSDFWSRGGLAVLSEAIGVAIPDSTTTTTTTTTAVTTSNTGTTTVAAPSFFTNFTSFSPFNFGVQRTVSAPTGHEQGQITQEKAALQPKQDPLLKLIKTLELNQGGRVDYALRETILDRANNYLSSLTVHVSYFDNIDCVGFIMDRLDGESISQSPRKT